MSNLLKGGDSIPPSLARRYEGQRCDLGGPSVVSEDEPIRGDPFIWVSALTAWDTWMLAIPRVCPCGYHAVTMRSPRVLHVCV